MKFRLEHNFPPSLNRVLIFFLNKEGKLLEGEQLQLSCYFNSE